MLMLLLLVLAALSLAVLYAKRSTSYWTRRGVPQVPGAVFPLGHFWASTFQRCCFGEDCCRLYWQAAPSDRLVGAYLFSKPAVVLRDPDLIKTALVKDFSAFHDRGFHVNEEADPLSGHLFQLPGVKWRALRTKLTPTFTSGKMKFMFLMLAACGRELTHVMADEPAEVELRDLVARYSTDVIASCAFGVEGRSLKDPDDDFRAWGRRIINPTIFENAKGIFSEIFPRLSAMLKIKVMNQEVEDYFMNLVKTTMEYRDTHNVTRGDFLQLLMKLRQGESLDDQPAAKGVDKKEFRMGLGEMAAQVLVFFIAGFDTSSATVSFTLHELAWNQEVQKKLQQEIDETLLTTGGEVTYDAVMGMHYMDKVVSETLRMYPPLPMLNRVLSRDYQVPGTKWTLEKGTAVIIPVMSLQRDPQYFPDPDTFDPERFSEENKAHRHPYTYLPFGDGPRNCIGMRFGLMQSKVALVSLLSRYSFEPCARTKRRLTMDPNGFVLYPDSGVWLRKVPRTG